ncbi:MAG: Glucosamine-6-phosphate deaminase [Cohnella sp.]|nr:Glucosamine-6-phosphate deaminase [Cohnella sp.]
MEVKILATAEELGIAAARHAADVINESIKKKGSARLLLSTGASQFEFFKAVVKADIDWSRVEVFHLDEYINMSEEHPASFKKYLKERLLAFVNVKKMHFVEGMGDIEQNIAKCTEEIRKAPIDLGLIGIGENAHIAFNDPPANFDTKEAFMVVELDDKCREQQFKEGWFKTKADVPTVALSMTVHQIMQCKVIISCVPYESKAVAIQRTLEEDVNNLTPATILKTHNNLFLYLDKDSAALLKSQT